MSAGTWYVKTGRTAVNWGTDVSGGVAQVDIAKLVIGTANEQWFLFARAGQPVTTDQVTAAQAETTGGAVPAALLPSNGVAPGGSAVTTSGIANGSVTLAKLGTDVKNAYVQVGQQVLSVTDPQFGALGDGATDDTAALQSAITYACSNSAALRFPSRTYKITAALTIPKSSDWQFLGLGNAQIVQYANNTPILRFTRQGTSRFHVENLSFKWNTAQTSANTASIAMSFGAQYDSAPDNGSGYFNWSATRLRFSNGYAGISQEDTTQNAALWGVDVRGLWHMPSMTGPCFVADTLASGNGQPNIALRNIYMRMDSCAGPGIAIRSAAGVTLENIEFNNGANCPVLTEIATVDGLTVNGWRSEQPNSPAMTSTGTGLLWLRGVKGARLAGLQVLNRTFNAGTSEHSLVYVSQSSQGVEVTGVALRNVTAGSGVTFSGIATDGAGSYFSAKGIVVTGAAGVGTVAELSPTAANSSVYQFTNSSGLTGYLTATPAFTLDAKGSFGQLVKVVNDAAYTVAAGDAVIIYKTLTAVRNVTLPDSTGSSGRRLIVCDGGVVGVNKYITITPQSGQTINGQPSYTLYIPYAGVELFNDGSTKWHARLLQPPAPAPFFQQTVFPSDGNYTVTSTDNVVLYKTLTASRTVTLPDARTQNGRTVRVVDGSGTAGTNNIVIGTTNSQTINGASTYTINTNGGLVELISDAANWFRVG